MAVPWRENEDDAKMDRIFNGEVVMMDKEHKEKLEMEEHVPVPRREHTQHVIIWRCSDSQRAVPCACRC